MGQRTPGFVGERLCQAREARGMTAADLANLVNLTPSTISKYEHNAQTPRPEVLEDIALKLNLPKERFLLPPKRTREERENRKIFYRSMASATKGARTKAERRYEWFTEMVEYLGEYFDLPKANLPVFDLPSDFRKLTPGRIEELAEECRAYWGIGKGPFPNCVRTLEKNGVIIARDYMEAETLDAFSEHEPTLKVPFIFLNADKNTAVRSRADMMHESAHLILHPNVDKKNITSKSDFRILENQAFRFASAILLPKREFLEELWGATLDSFRSLKARWKVSIGLMIKRCEDLHIINEEQAKRLWMNRSRRGWNKEEPLDDSMIVEEPTMIKNCFHLLVENGVRTRQQIVDDLLLSPLDIESLSGLNPGYFQERMADVAEFPTLKVRYERGDAPKREQPGKVIPLSSRKQA